MAGGVSGYKGDGRLRAKRFLLECGKRGEEDSGKGVRDSRRIGGGLADPKRWGVQGMVERGRQGDAVGTEGMLSEGWKGGAGRRGGRAGFREICGQPAGRIRDRGQGLERIAVLLVCILTGHAHLLFFKERRQLERLRPQFLSELQPEEGNSVANCLLRHLTRSLLRHTTVFVREAANLRVEVVGQAHKGKVAKARHLLSVYRRMKCGSGNRKA
eukprot:3523162-Rhodomonas_salina.1